jgi:hypothetical protein
MSITSVVRRVSSPKGKLVVFITDPERRERGRVRRREG